MPTDITKFKQLYKIVFKHEQDDDKTISEDNLEYVKLQWLSGKPIDIAGELFNPFEIRKIIKWNIDDEAQALLSVESPEIQKIVKKEIKLYGKRNISKINILRMINKAKGHDDY